MSYCVISPKFRMKSLPKMKLDQIRIGSNFAQKIISLA